MNNVDPGEIWKKQNKTKQNKTKQQQQQKMVEK